MKPDIYIDGDACPVKNETFRVAQRYSLMVYVVVNRAMRVPAGPMVRLVVVPGGFDAADDWIAGHAERGDLVITADIPLAARCIANGARVLGVKGREFTEAGIGDAIATRTLMDTLRQMGEVTGGPAAMDNKSRSRFLSKLDEMVNALR
ncbi:MAG: YaiI/YqxD family protein [Myxococcota bacterium]|jgi:hypothetical protein